VRPAWAPDLRVRPELQEQPRLASRVAARQQRLDGNVGRLGGEQAAVCVGRVVSVGQGLTDGRRQRAPAPVLTTQMSTSGLRWWRSSIFLAASNLRTSRRKMRSVRWERPVKAVLPSTTCGRGVRGRVRRRGCAGRARLLGAMCTQVRFSTYTNCALTKTSTTSESTSFSTQTNTKPRGHSFSSCSAARCEGVRAPPQGGLSSTPRKAVPSCERAPGVRGRQSGRDASHSNLGQPLGAQLRVLHLHRVRHSLLRQRLRCKASEAQSGRAARVAHLLAAGTASPCAPRRWAAGVGGA